MNKHMYFIYELAPTVDSLDDKRLIQIFEDKKSASHVLTALEEVNYDFSVYTLEERSVK